jgi:hypothetical protein
MPPVDVGRTPLKNVEGLFDELDQILLGLGLGDLEELAIDVDLLAIELNEAAHQ